jgi:hypothetical protein
VEKIMMIFSDVKLINFLEILESALCSFDLKDDNVPKNVKVTPSNKDHSFRSYDTNTVTISERIRTFFNSGPKTRSDIVLLEGSYQYHLIFSSVSGDGQSTLQLVLFLFIIGNKFRLYYPTSNSSTELFKIVK